MNTTPLSDVLKELQSALSEAERAEHTLEQAKAKLAPLEEAATEKRNAVAVLMNQYQSLTNPMATATVKRGRGPKKEYNISPESKVASTEKRTYTKAINAGKSEAEAKKAGKAAASLLAKKLGVKV